MAFDFRALQIQASKIIASGSTGRNALLLIYPYSSATDNAGGVNFPITGIGTDVMAFFSGAISSKGVSDSHGTTLYGGDVHYSGSLYIDGTISASQGTVLLSGSNFGVGQEVLSSISGSTLNFRTLAGAGSVAVTTNGDTIVFSGSGGGTNLSILDEGVEITPSASSLNFVGAAVLASASGDSVTISIAGGSGSAGTIEVKATGSTIAPTASFVDFRGPALTSVTPSGFGVIVSYNTGTLETQEQGSSLASDTKVLNFTGPGVSSSVNGNNVDIIISGSGDITSGSNVGGGNEVFKQKNGSSLEFRTFVAGPNVTVNTNGDAIEVSGSATSLSGTIIASDYMASANELVFVAAEGITASLPSTPSDGDEVAFMLSTNNRFVLNASPNSFFHHGHAYEQFQGWGSFRIYKYATAASAWYVMHSNHDFRLQGRGRREADGNGVISNAAISYQTVDTANATGQSQMVEIKFTVTARSGSSGDGPAAYWKGHGLFTTPTVGANSGSMVRNFLVFDTQQKDAAMSDANITFVTSGSTVELFLTGTTSGDPTEFVVDYEISDGNYSRVL